MAQIFRINKNSTLPTLRMELVNDGKYDFFKSYMFNNSIQNASIKFSMRNENGVLKVSKQEANIFLLDNGGCDETYVIEYKWKERDTKEVGKYEAWFEIEIYGDIYEDNTTYDSGKLIMPINEPLYIYIQ